MSSNTPQSLRAAIEAARTQKGASKGNSSKTPAGYNREKNQFVVAMLSHPEPLLSSTPDLAIGGPSVNWFWKNWEKPVGAEKPSLMPSRGT